MTDYEDLSENFFLFSLFTSNPIIGTILSVLAIVFAVKACDAKEDCSHRKCATGTPMLIKGECVCTEKAK